MDGKGSSVRALNIDTFSSSRVMPRARLRSTYLPQRPGRQAGQPRTTRHIMRCPARLRAAAEARPEGTRSAVQMDSCPR